MARFNILVQAFIGLSRFVGCIGFYIQYCMEKKSRIFWPDFWDQLFLDRVLGGFGRILGVIFGGFLGTF